MKYFIGIVILLFGILIMLNLALKTRYTRKRLSKKTAINFILQIKEIEIILVSFFHYFLVNQTNQKDHEIYIYSNNVPCINNKKKYFINKLAGKVINILKNTPMNNTNIPI